MKLLIIISCCLFFIACGNINSPEGNTIDLPPLKNEIEAWYTSFDKSQLLSKQKSIITFSSTLNIYPTIEINNQNKLQFMDGFGYTLTGGSASLINKMDENPKNSLLNELFGNSEESIGISYLRISIGSSDLDEKIFSYSNEPDETLKHFSLAYDTLHLVPILKKILKINPYLKIMATPWSPPIWMKTNKASMGGELLPQYYNTYADYFIKYIEAMKIQGINIDAVTIQNEPQHGGNNPSMIMSETQQAVFIKNHLGPKFNEYNIKTKIIVWDHNCDRPDYPINILNDQDAKQYIDGSAFHLYSGQINALSTVKAAHPDKNIYFTEQWTSAKGIFGDDLKWHMKNVVIGSISNWSKIVLEWNLANDPNYGPHTPGGCTLCLGAITINGNTIQRNVSYYIIAHASKFIPAGSSRISSTNLSQLPSIAFITPQGKIVLIVLNSNSEPETFNIGFDNKIALVTLPANTVSTYTW